jgi:hypothetical protein
MKKNISTFSFRFIKKSYLLLLLILILIYRTDIIGQISTVKERVAGDSKSLTGDNLPTFEDVGWIYHYLTGYYSKWEAEENQTNLAEVGVKHQYGDTATWRGVKCWSTKNISTPKDNIIYGPDYSQDKIYNRSFFHYMLDGVVNYIPRFSMALDKKVRLDPDEDVCVIKTLYRYKDKNTNTYHDTTFLERKLKIEDFDTSGNFKYIYFNIIPHLAMYRYYQEYILNEDESNIQNSQLPKNIIDREAQTGIQFKVDWLRTDTLCTLYIDYIEVVDDFGWKDYLDSPCSRIEILKDYISNYMDWKYIHFLSSQIKLTSIDNYLPVTILDSLFRSVGAPSLLPEVDEYQLSTSPGFEIPDKWIRKENFKNILIAP